MTEQQRQLLAQQLNAMHKAATALNWSFERCQPLDLQQLSLEDEEKLETLTARFARMSDILIQKILRLVDQLDLESPGTVRDRINRAEKKQLINSADEFVIIRELRNAIAHEYEQQTLHEIYQQVLHYCPLLLATPERIEAYLAQIN